MKNWLGSEIPLLFAKGDALRHLLQMIAIEAVKKQLYLSDHIS